MGAEAGAVTISAAVGAETAAGAPVVEVATAAGATVVGAAAAAGARSVRRKTLHKTCKAVTTKRPRPRRILLQQLKWQTEYELRR